MKRYYYTWMTLLVFSFVLSASTCGGDSNNDEAPVDVVNLVGIWECTASTESWDGGSEEGRRVGKRLVIYSNNTYSSTSGVLGEGTYTLSGNSLTAISSTGRLFTMTVSLNGSTLKMSGTTNDGYSFDYTFRRVYDNGGGGSISIPDSISSFSIIGTWRYYFESNDPSRGTVYDQVTFKSDYTGVLIEEVGYGSDRPNYFTWIQSGNNIRITFVNDGGYTVNWIMTDIIDNNTVIINDGSHVYTVYRQEDNGGGGNTPSTGTLYSPLTASQAYDIVATMEADRISSEEYYVKGKICRVKYYFSAEYGTAVFNISDDGYTEGKEFTVYSTYYKAYGQSWVEGNTQVAVGDEVLICGKVVNYHGNTPEFAERKNYVVSINNN